jgi:23S rRNA pseudouridine955/2504/2580 synthase
MAGGARTLTFVVSSQNAGRRLDRLIKDAVPGVSHALLCKLVRKGGVLAVSPGQQAAARSVPRSIATRLDAGTVVSLRGLPDDLQTESDSAKLGGSPAERQRGAAALADLPVLYEDDTMLALDKPPGLAVQGGSGLTTSVDHMIQATGSELRLVHR